MPLKDADFQTVFKQILLLSSYKLFTNGSNFHVLDSVRVDLDNIDGALAEVRVTLFNQASKQLVFYATINHFGNWFPVVFHRGIWLLKIEQAIAKHEQQHMSEIDDSAYFS
ncbi:MAG: hypothetical protein WAQ98_11205 [Blastocatellia bacterium]